MLPAPWVDRFQGFPLLARLRSWIEGNGVGIPDFGEVSFGLWRPSLDLCESVEGFVLRIELPGVDPGQVRIHADRGLLTIAGTRDESREIGEIGFPLRERTFGSFSRSIQLPAEAEAGQHLSTFEHGVLTIRVPRREGPDGVNSRH